MPGPPTLESPSPRKPSGQRSPAAGRTGFIVLLAVLLIGTGALVAVRAWAGGNDGATGCGPIRV